MLYLIQGETLTSIGDAIREKTGGSSLIAPSDMPEEIENIETLPVNYVVGESIKVVNKVNSHNVSNNIFRILAISDGHIDKTNAQLVASSKHAGQALSLIRRALDVDCCMWLGDATAGSATTTYENGVAEIQMMHKDISDAFDSLPQFHAVGNHDNLHNSSAAALDGHTPIWTPQMYDLVGIYNTGTVDPENTKGGYCYYDFSTKKIRVILLNSVETYANTQSDDLWISGRQIQWLADRLYEVGNKTDASSWGVIVCSHHPIDWQTFRLSQVFKAYLNGTSVSLVYDGVTISKDFSGHNEARLICQFHGHTHNYLSGKVHAIGYSNGPVDEGEMDLLRMAIPNACFWRNNEYGNNQGPESNGLEFGESTTYPKTADSGEDTAFCVVTIDLNNGKIYADYYGSGYDRTLSYIGEIYLVTVGNVGKATVNAPQFVDENDPLNATITVPSGYTIESVTVTMGGTVVPGAYSAGTIYIASVTGDIEISASVSGYTNIIDTVGYNNGYRISTSTGNLTQENGYVATNFIDLSEFVGNNDTVIIRAYGVDFRSTAHYNCTFAYYRPDQSAAGGGAYTSDFNNKDTVGLANFDSSGNMTLELSPTSYPLTVVGNRPLLRIAGYGTGENLIVTINEPIS